MPHLGTAIVIAKTTTVETAIAKVICILLAGHGSTEDAVPGPDSRENPVGTNPQYPVRKST